MAASVVRITSGQAAGITHSGIEVRDIDAAVERLRARGIAASYYDALLQSSGEATLLADNRERREITRRVDPACTALRR